MKAIVAAVMLTAGMIVPAAAQDGEKGTASMINGEGKTIGSASLMQTPNGVLITLDLQGVPQGEHAFHVHEKGVCDPATKFESAGAHFNPEKKQHGFATAGGPHGGDMPNLFVGADGVLKAEVINPHIRLDPGSNSLFGAGGGGTVGTSGIADASRALVLHAKPDDHKSQPSGNAGDRIACGVVKKQQ
jgi:Cu-Zn family superoxide dismutase